MDLKADIFEPVANRVAARATSLVQVGRMRRKGRSGMGIEGWLKVEVLAALGDLVVDVLNKGADLLLRDKVYVELKGASDLNLSWVCTDGLRHGNAACLFLGNGDGISWQDGKPLPYGNRGDRVNLIAHRVFSDGERNWVIALIEPSKAG